MRPSLISLLICLISLTAGAQQTVNLEAAGEMHAKNVTIAEAQHRDRVFSFKKVYLAELARQEVLLQTKGDLDGLLAVRAEKERMDRPLTPQESKELPAVIRAGRAKFDQSVARSAAQQEADVALQNRAYASSLERAQTQLTRAGNIEGALKAKGLLQALQSGRRPDPVPVITPAATQLAAEKDKMPPGPNTRIRDLRTGLNGTTWKDAGKWKDAGGSVTFQDGIYNKRWKYEVPDRDKVTILWNPNSKLTLTLDNDGKTLLQGGKPRFELVPPTAGE